MRYLHLSSWAVPTSATGAAGGRWWWKLKNRKQRKAVDSTRSQCSWFFLFFVPGLKRKMVDLKRMHVSHPSGLKVQIVTAMADYSSRKKKVQGHLPGGMPILPTCLKPRDVGFFRVLRNFSIFWKVEGWVPHWYFTIIVWQRMRSTIAQLEWLHFDTLLFGDLEIPSGCNCT